MKPKIRNLLCAAFLCFQGPYPAYAQLGLMANSAPAGTVPGGINYQGRLMDNGFPVTGTKTMIFRLYAAAFGGAVLWTSGSQSISVTQGIFGTTLGISTQALAGASQKYLEVQVEGTTLSPREPLNAVPYAIFAKGLEEQLVISTVTVGDSLISSGTLRTSKTLFLGGSNALGGGSFPYQMSLGYNGTDTYQHYIRTRHQGGAVANNAIDFYTSDGTQEGVFPTNAILGMSINGGNVGVGTAGPSKKLHVVGGLNDALFLEGNGTIFEMRNTGGANHTRFALNVWQDDSVRFFESQNDGVSWYNPMNFKAGNVGIGTASPGAKLEVSRGDSHDVATFSQTSSATLNTDVWWKGSLNWLLSQRNNAINGGSAGDFWFYNSSVGPVMTLKSGGNVGIGTTNPSTKLQVIGDFNTTGEGRFGSSSGLFRIAPLSGWYTDLTHNLYYSGGWKSLLGGPGARINPAGGTNTESYIAFETSPDATSLAQEAPVNLQERMRIDKDGNVGIGTASPEVFFHLRKSINGSVSALIENTNAGTSSYSVLALRNDGGKTVSLFLSGASKSDDGGVNSATLRTESGGGNLHLGAGGVGLMTVTTGGDVYIRTQGNGLILRATDGATCYRLTVNNAGTLATASVACP